MSDQPSPRKNVTWPRRSWWWEGSRRPVLLHAGRTPLQEGPLGPLPRKNTPGIPGCQRPLPFRGASRDRGVIPQDRNPISQNIEPPRSGRGASTRPQRGEKYGREPAPSAFPPLVLLDQHCFLPDGRYSAWSCCSDPQSCLAIDPGRVGGILTHENDDSPHTGRWREQGSRGSPGQRIQEAVSTILRRISPGYPRRNHVRISRTVRPFNRWMIFRTTFCSLACWDP